MFKKREEIHKMRCEDKYSFGLRKYTQKYRDSIEQGTMRQCIVRKLREKSEEKAQRETGHARAHSWGRSSLHVPNFVDQEEPAKAPVQPVGRPHALLLSERPLARAEFEPGRLFSRQKAPALLQKFGCHADDNKSRERPKGPSTDIFAAKK